jgi:hypothetical protein
MKKKYRVKDYPEITRTTERSYQYAVVVVDIRNNRVMLDGFCRDMTLAKKKVGPLEKRLFIDSGKSEEDYEIQICEVEEIKKKYDA